MTSVQTFTKTGAKATTKAKLSADVFGLEVKNHALIKQSYLAYLANGRENLAKTLKRGEVRGGGRKPWKQKGTGRARFGSSRTPIWRKGGIVFGPLGKENYSIGINKKATRQAIRQALSLKAKCDAIRIIEAFEIKDGKTANAAKLLAKLGADRETLLVVENKDDSITRATNNIPTVKVVQAMYLNTHDIINAHTIVITEKAVAIVENWLTTKEVTK
jgi:large subunit ribosomal protein L4